MTFFEIFKKTCNEKGTTPTATVRALGLSSSSVTSWKAGMVPQHGTLLKIADHFGVTVDYLLGNEKEKPVAEDELSEEVVIYHRDGKTVKKKFTKEQMRMIAQMLDAIPEDED